MIRFAFALILGTFTAYAASQAESGVVVQDKKKDKKKDAAVAPVGELKEDYSRVLPVFDPGSHTQPISAIGFTPDKKKLITVGQDFSVQVWSPATGERLDILRLPGYGREKGFDPGRWDVAAVSPDGSRVAVGGNPKYLNELDAKDNNSARLVVVDVTKRTVVRVQLRTGRNRPVAALAFTPDGNGLAIAIADGPKEDAVVLVVGDLTTRIENARPGLQTDDCEQVPVGKKAPTAMAYSPDGKRLVVGAGHSLMFLSIPAGSAPKATVERTIPLEGNAYGIGWSPDGTQFVHSVMANLDAGTTRIRGFDVRNANGDLVKDWRVEDLIPALQKGGFVTVFGVRFLDPQTIYFVANGATGSKFGGGGTIAGVLDTATGKSRRLGAHTDGMITVPVGSASTDGQLVAYTVTGNTEVQVGTANGSAFIRCGQHTPIPYYLGWAKDPAKPGFAWTTERERGETQDRDPANLTFGFDLGTVEPLAAVKAADFDTARWKHGEWSVKTFGGGTKAPDDGFTGTSRLMKGDKPFAGFPFGNSGGRTLIPNGNLPPFVAYRHHLSYEPERAYLARSDGSVVTRLLPDATRFTDMVSSSDGRFLATTTGTPRIVVYRTDGSPYPLLSFAQLNGEWVCWTPEGYYAASPGGERMFGWAVNNGPNSLVTFYPAEKFAKHFRRPDVIKLAIEKGSVKEALAALNVVVPPKVEEILPPAAKLELLMQDGTGVKVKATASSGAKDKPIRSMRVLLDGRPLPEGKGVWTPVPGGVAEGVFEFTIPGGLHELRVLAVGDDGNAVSDPVLVRAPKSPTSQPTIYRICIGINDYDVPGLRLPTAAKDARDVYAALETYCVGPINRFGTAKGELLIDKDATRPRVLAALAAAQKTVRPGDLLVIYFSGHGVKTDEGYFLLTREANPATGLKGTAIAGDDLAAELKNVECSMLFILDACQSAGVRSAINDLTRLLVNENVGVTVMSSSMEHETSSGTAENGFFTLGLLKGLKAGENVPFDPYDRQIYAHDLYSVTRSEVRRATNGKQNPFFISPWTAPPLALREVPLR